MIRRLRGDPTTRDLHIIILSAKGKPENIVDGCKPEPTITFPNVPGGGRSYRQDSRVYRHPPTRQTQSSTTPVALNSFFLQCQRRHRHHIDLPQHRVCLAQLESKTEIAVIDMVLPWHRRSFLGAELPMTLAKLTQEAPLIVRPSKST